MTVFAKALAAPAILAVIALASAPAQAAELPVLSHVPVPTAHNYGPYVGASYGWGWGGRGWGNRHRRGPSVGDVLTGVIVLGTIAAVTPPGRITADGGSSSRHCEHNSSSSARS